MFIIPRCKSKVVGNVDRSVTRNVATTENNSENGVKKNDEFSYHQFESKIIIMKNKMMTTKIELIAAFNNLLNTKYELGIKELDEILRLFPKN